MGTVLFFSVFIEEAGLPVPAVPVLLAAGALAGSGKFSLAQALLLGLAAASLGDLLWFYLGRHKGGKILKFLCRLSLEPDSCVGSTKSVFERHGSRGLVIAKFVPGLGTIMPPLAGMFNVGFWEFLLFDGLGSLLYVGSFLGLGYAFSDKLGEVKAMAERMGSAAVAAVAACFGGYLLYKWIRRRMFFNKLKMARITVDELYKMQESGHDVLVFDVRSSVDLKAIPHKVRGAKWIAKEEFHKRHHEIPRDREIVLYCNCPNEASAAIIAALLQKHGIERVRPLLGGLDAWMEKSFPTDAA